MNFYAEYNTDKIIREKYFHDLDYKGIVVEVGGGTPQFLSMSKHFKDSGWRAIIIEPNPVFYQEHLDAGNEVYKYACSFEDKKNQEFIVVKQNVDAYGGVITDHSFSSIAVKEEYLSKTGFKLTESNTEKIMVNIRRLDSILDEASVNKVDLLSIDTEGWELEVMRGIDLSRIDCRVIVLENLFHHDEYTAYMNSNGYVLDIKIEYNYVYVKNI